METAVRDIRGPTQKKKKNPHLRIPERPQQTKQTN